MLHLRAVRGCNALQQILQERPDLMHCSHALVDSCSPIGGRVKAPSLWKQLLSSRPFQDLQSMVLFQHAKNNGKIMPKTVARPTAQQHSVSGFIPNKGASDAVPRQACHHCSSTPAQLIQLTHSVLETRCVCLTPVPCQVVGVL